MPPDTVWHFIGHIQTNKVKKLVSVPNLALVESVDSIKLAGKLQKELAKTDRQSPLPILVQVQTGDEGTKNGLAVSDVDEMIKFLANECPKL